jgi:predicted nucleic acid-binding protein
MLTGHVREYALQLLEADGVMAPETDALQRALSLYATTRGLDFADAYLAGLAVTSGPDRVASFDADLDRIPGVTRICR